MPWLKINSEAAFALATALIYIAGSHIEVSQHRHDTIGCAACSFDVRTFCTHIVNAKTNTASRL